MEPPNLPNVLPHRRSLQRQMQPSNNIPTPAISRQSSSKQQLFSMKGKQQVQHHHRTRTESTPTVAPHTTVARMTYAPTTQTTVVTTTTTTTTTLPQLVMRPPRNLNTLDPKEFPLAAQPTPAPLKRFCFDLNGKQTYFREEDDAESSIRQLNDLVENLHHNNGVIVNEVRHPERYGMMPGETITSPPVPTTRDVLAGRKRPASPVSLCEAVERAMSSQSGRQKRRQTGKSRLGPGNKAETPSPSKKNGKTSRNTTPINTRDTFSPSASAHAPRALRPVHQTLAQLQNRTPLISPQHQTPQQPSQQQETPLTLSPQLLAANTDEDESMAGTPTPQDDNDSVSTVHEETQAAEGTDGEGARLSSEETTLSSAQPLSLPSPSLSPVTAALTHGNHSYFASMEADDITSPLELPPNQEDVEDDGDVEMVSPQQALSPYAGDPGLSVMSIPDMLDSFDAMPSSVKSYLMYQFLRRCSKHTLQTVANVVNPALKCDFLTMLPLELSLQVIKHLDVKSLCAAAQVSKRWRLIIDSDEWTWKRLFENDGYQLQDNELDRAIREGWGYQDPIGDDDCEVDINRGVVQSAAASPVVSHKKSSSKRRRTRAQSKQFDAKRTQVETLGKEEFNEVIHEIISNSSGPAAAADAAEKAGSRASVGLPSLRNLHLFKSIYRRHHIIRKNWMNPASKPKHISFRGHQRHVVTCLQFDTDKILTGSDDTNINVYDTNTGALRTTLEGHEGGVWALQYEGNTLVSGSTDRTVRVWDIEKGECTQIFHGHTSTVRCLQILMPTKIKNDEGVEVTMPKVPLIITGSRDSTLRIWKRPGKDDPTYLQGNMEFEVFSNPANNPYFLRTLNGHQHSVRAIAAHGDTLVSGSYDYSVKVWRISTGECVHTLRGHTQKVYSVVLDHKRDRCISGSMDTIVKVWCLKTGNPLYTLEGHTQLVGLLDLSHDRLVSAAADSTLRIWDPENGQCKHILTAHTGAITCFQHDDHKVISGSDRTLKMWNVQTGEFVRDLLTDLTGVWQVKFNERRCVAAVQRDQVTYIEVLDFGAARDGVSEDKRGRRIVVDLQGNEIPEGEDGMDEEMEEGEAREEQEA